MKKLIFLIPFMLVLSSCGDDNSSTPSNINSDQTSGQATAGIGGNITPNPDGDNSGSTGGSTTNPVNPGSDESGTSTDPVNPGSDESGTSTDPVNPGSDDTGTSTDPVNPGSDDTGTSTDPVNPGSDDTGTSTDPVNTGSNESGDESGSEIVDVVVNPGGNESGDESGSEVVSVVVVPGGNEEDKEAPKYTDTIFDYINRDNLYYRSTLSASEKAVYDRLYDTFKSFYGRNTGPVEPCTDGVLCHATDGFIETDPEPDKYKYSCIDDVETGSWNGVCDYDSWKEQYKRWAEENCIYPETGEPRITVVFEGALFGQPVCGHERYNSLYAEWLYKNTVGVPVSLLNVQNGLTNSALKSIEEKLMLDLSNLYLFKAGGQVSNTKYDILNYYKIQPVSSFSSDSAVKTQWASQMKQIQEKVYRAIWDYTDGKTDKFEDLLNKYLWALIDNFVVYDANGASDITGAITGSFNAKGLARLFTFACQISSDYQCVYVEGKANYSTGFGNHGGEEFDHAWVIVKNSKLCSNNEDALIDPLRLNGLRLADTRPYLCVSSPENAGYKPNIK